MEGRSQQTMDAITPPSMARTDWKIVRAVSEISNHTLPYDSLIGVRQRMKELSPNLVFCNENIRTEAIVPPKSGSALPKVKESVQLNTRLVDLLDYYQTDVISRASQTMAKCVLALRKELDKRDDKQASSN